MHRTEPVVVRVVRTRIWHALEDDEVAGKAHVVRRPDRRYFVAIDAWRDEVFDVLLDAVLQDLPADLATIVGEEDEEELARWTRRGFDARRREDEYEIRLTASDGRLAAPPPGYALVPAADVDPDDLRRLDEELRQDVPGMRGWVNAPEEPLDPAASLVAVDDATGAHAGLVRLRVAGRWAKLGLVGVRREHRRRGLARALLAAAFRPVADLGVEFVLAEADAENAPARALLTGFGARRTGGTVELVLSAGSGGAEPR